MKKYSFFFLLISLCLNVSSSNYYWVGGTGNWSDFSNHWSTTSGGSVFHVQTPTPSDNVYFDVNSFVSATDTIYIDSTMIYCKDMDWTGVTGSPTLYNADLGLYKAIKMYGSLMLDNNMFWNFYGSIDFESIISGNTITSNGVIMATELRFKGVSGSWILMDTLSTGSIRIYAGALLNTNNQVINCSSINNDGFRNDGTANLGTSIINCFDFSTGPLITANSSVINVISDFSSANGISYNKVNSLGCSYCSSSITTNNSTFNQIIAQGLYFTLGGSGNTITKFSSYGLTFVLAGNSFTRADFMDDLIIYDGNIFDSLYFNTPGKTIQIDATSTITINDQLQINANCSAYTNLKSSLAGQQATINKSGSSVAFDYLILQDINASGTSFTANNSIDNGNVSGWIINSPAPRNLFWVGGTSNWNNPNNWSLTSGGAGGNCPPTQLDNVYFDVNSFVSATDTIYIDSTINYCRDMNWTGITGPTLYNDFGIYKAIKMYGSLMLDNNMFWNFYGSIDFESIISGNTITTSGTIIDGTELRFKGAGGSWILMDTLSTGSIRIYAGASLNTNNQIVNCSSIYNDGFRNDGTANLGTSVINCFDFSTGPLITANSSVINVISQFTSADGISYNKVNSLGCSYCSPSITTNNSTFNQIIAQGLYFTLGGSGNTITEFSSSGSTFVLAGNIFTRADFMNDLVIYDGNIFDSLYFNNPGKTIQIAAAGTITINDQLQINGNSSFPIILQSTISGIQATINKATDTVCTNFIYLQDIVGAGGAAFYAGINSFDLGNNTGWSFTSCQQPISNVWPGDANYDLVANNIDILNIGLAYNEMGFVRPGATITWQAEPCLDWFAQFIDTTNVKHADCDGNGIVDANDTMAVSLNYSFTHPALAPNNSLSRSPYDLYIDIPTASLNQGDTVSIPVKLGTAVSPATNIYGIAFTVNYDQTLIENGDIYVTYDSSWLVSATNNVHLEKNFSSFGQLDVGFSRINHLNQSGSGTIATLHFVVSTTNNGNLILSLSNIQAVNYTGNILPITSYPDSVNIVTGINNYTIAKEKSLLYPNPASNYFYFDYYSEEIEAAGIIIYTIHGAEIKSINLQKTVRGFNHFKNDITDVPAGVYFCTLKTENKSITKQLIIIR